jgi:tetratricopeptide (TPR) repeat protein
MEDVGKGLALGLVALLAYRSPDWSRTAGFFGVAVLGLLIALGVAGYRFTSRNRRTRGPLPSFLLYLVLDNPATVYAGILSGMLTAGLAQAIWFGVWSALDLLLALGIGLAAGLLFHGLRLLENCWLRSTSVLLLGACVTAGILISLGTFTTLLEGEAATLLGLHVLLAIPLLYLLTFAGRAEETELEIGAMCVALGVALWLLLPEARRLIAVLTPVVVYFLYLQYVLRRLNVFKHVLRGMSFANLHMHRDALLAYRRALQLDRRNALAVEGRWRVHKDIDFSQAIQDAALMELIDLDLCVTRAGELLMGGKPTSEQLAEAHKLLDLVLDQRPMMQPAILYWRAIAHTHARDFDKAEAELRAVLDPATYPPDDSYRESVLLPCWQLAFTQHKELRRRVGEPMVTKEGRRPEGIALVERTLAREPEHLGALELKQVLYEDLTEQEYDARRGEAACVPVGQFDHGWCVDRGLAMVGDLQHWRRGAEFLRMGVRATPERAPSLLQRVVRAAQQAGDEPAHRFHEELLKHFARQVGAKNLAAEDRQAYFTTLKNMGDAAHARGDTEQAIENLSLFVESSDCGLDTLRLLGELHERKGDVVGALVWNEKALVVNAKDPLLLERRDRYYYSLLPEQVDTSRERLTKWLDVSYCTRKARSLLDLKTGGPEQVEWGLHLAELARRLQSESIFPSVLVARARLRRGEQKEALSLLEQVRERVKDQSLSGDEEEAWFMCCRLLGDLYLQSVGRPDLALACLSDYRKCSKSGADTLFKIGQAYEALGDPARAKKWYQNVTVYDHPLASDAYAAISRLEAAN